MKLYITLKITICCTKYFVSWYYFKILIFISISFRIISLFIFIEIFFPTSFIFITKSSSLNYLHLLIILDINVDVIEVIFDDQKI